jgi:DNA-binding transcriptional LysR family regulator
VLVGTLASTKLAQTLRLFGKAHPQMRLMLRTANNQEVSEIVRRGEATLGLRYFADPDDGIISQLVMEESLVVACSPDHSLAGRSVRNARKLDGERWVSFAPQRGRREAFANVVGERLAAAGFGSAEVVHIDSLTAQKRFVEAGFGLALLVVSAIEEERRIGTIKMIDVPALRTKLPVMLVRRRDG